MSQVYAFLKQEGIAHTTKMLPLVELCKSLGATYLDDINIGQNAKYISEHFMQESIQALAEIISQDIMKSLQTSPFFSVCIDETTDVSVTKQLIIYGRYLI